MSRVYLLKSLLVPILMVSGCSHSQNEFADQEEFYFGQKPPGLIPELFAPGIVSIDGGNEGTVSFSPDLDEIYFAAGSESEKSAIYFSKLEGNEWALIEKADFTRGEKDEEVQPFVSPDGKRIYFTVYSSDVFDTGIWYVSLLEQIQFTCSRILRLRSSSSIRSC